MGAALAADAVMVVHFLFIAFALGGSFLILKWPKVIWLHLPALAWGAWIEAMGDVCPITPLENNFRALAGESTYGEGVIVHYLAPIIYPSGLTRGWQFVALGVLLVFNLAGYGLVLTRRRGRS
jgi:hypothetical protein